MGSLRKTRQVSWEVVQDYGRSEWKRTLRDLEKALNVAYHDILNELDSTWGGQQSYCDPEQLSRYLEG